MTTYISIDIEADGPIPGPNSMLSLGAAAFVPYDDGTYDIVGTFRTNLAPLPDAQPDPATQKWWADHPDAYTRVTTDPQDPTKAMHDFVTWCRGLPNPHNLVVVGYPVTYDFTFVYWYTVKFTGFPAPFGFAALDIKTLAMTKMGCPFRAVSKRTMPRRWFRAVGPHTHDALDDAIGQGHLLMAILADQ